MSAAQLTHGSRRKIALIVAPVAHQHTVLPDGVRNPLTAEEVATQTIDCAQAGAAVVHLHVRNEQGAIIGDLGVFRRTIELIRRQSDIVLNVSTGGVSTLTLEQRCVGLNDPRVETASLNMGSTNFGESVYINTLPDIRYWAGRMRETGTQPELEAFAPGMIESARLLLSEGVLTEPLLVNICLGFPSAFSATTHNLDYMVSLVPPGARWGFLHEGMPDMSLLIAAVAAGAQWIRVGFEDSALLHCDAIAGSNVDLVRHLRELLERLGVELMTPTETRELLGVPALR